ncbi:protein rolling stone-like [Lineus longissimus]|uniref:protein rolling stone-like n=1 Tax=Lineus longissimus TaxID=88925 RepID=UPI002B4F37DE
MPLPGLSSSIRKYCTRKPGVKYALLTTEEGTDMRNKMALCDWCRREFRLDNIGFANAHRFIFVSSQWNIRLAYVIYRIVLALYLSAWMTYSLVTFGLPETNQWKWFIYIGNWSFLVFVVYALMSAIMTVYYEATHRAREQQYEIEAGKDHMMEQFLADVVLPTKDVASVGLSRNYRAYSTESLEPIIPDEEETANMCQKICWVLYNVAANICFVASIAYWVLIYDNSPLGGALIQTYVINSVLVVIDLCVSYISIRIAHAWMGMAFCGLYVVFSCVYWILGGTNVHGRHFIYNEFDFQDLPGVAAIYVCAVIVFFVPAVQCLLYAIYRFRLLTRKRSSRN